MVIESIINPKSKDKKYWQMFIVGFFYTTLGILLGLWIFREHASLFMVFFTVFAAIPFFYYAIKQEELNEIKLNSERKILISHFKLISMFMILFVGMCFSFVTWYLVLPDEVSTDLYKVQSETIVSLNNNIQARYIDPVGVFGKIFINNLRVLTFCILFAFIFGVGALFILTWNASVISTAIASFIEKGVGVYGSFWQSFFMGFLRYFLHGIPEILAYFVGGLAGSIISIAIINKHFGTDSFEKILVDSSELIIIAVGILFFAGLIEVWITPLFF